jgi:hypothetical protein
MALSQALSNRARPQHAGPKLPEYPGNREVSGSRPSVAALGAAQAGAQAPALARVLAGAMVAAAAWVLAEAPAAPAAVRAEAMAAAAAAEASGSAAAAAVWEAAVPAARDRRVLRARGKDRLAPGHDSPAGCWPPRRRSLSRLQCWSRSLARIEAATGMGTHFRWTRPARRSVSAAPGQGQGRQCCRDYPDEFSDGCAADGIFGRRSVMAVPVSARSGVLRSCERSASRGRPWRRRRECRAPRTNGWRPAPRPGRSRSAARPGRRG